MNVNACISYKLFDTFNSRLGSTGADLGLGAGTGAVQRHGNFLKQKLKNN